MIGAGYIIGRRIAGGNRGWRKLWRRGWSRFRGLKARVTHHVSRKSRVQHLMAQADFAMARREWPIAAALWRDLTGDYEGQFPDNVYVRHITALCRIPDYAEADRVIAVARTRVTDPQVRLWLSRRSAENAMAEQEWSEALLRWAPLLDGEADSYAIERIARIHCALDQLDQAEEVLKDGLRLYPGSHELAVFLGDIAMRRRQWARAAELYEPVAATDGGRSALRASVQSSLACRHLHQFERSERHLGRTLLQEPGQVRVWRRERSGGFRMAELVAPAEEAAGLRIEDFIRHAFGACDMEGIDIETVPGGNANRGCFRFRIHARIEGHVRNIDWFEKWLIHNPDTAKDSRELHFYKSIYPRLNKAGLDIAPAPCYIIECGTQRILGTDFVEGENGGERWCHLATRDDLKDCLAGSLASIASVAMDEAAIDEAGEIDEEQLSRFARKGRNMGVSESSLEAFRDWVRRCNQEVYRPENLVLCHNDLSWSNVVFRRDQGGRVQMVAFDWDRCRRNALGADLRYIIHNRDRELIVDMADRYVGALSGSGRRADRSDAIAGAYYAALQWAMDRALKLDEPRKLQNALQAAERLVKILDRSCFA